MPTNQQRLCSRWTITTRATDCSRQARKKHAKVWAEASGTSRELCQNAGLNAPMGSRSSPDRTYATRCRPASLFVALLLGLRFVSGFAEGRDSILRLSACRAAAKHRILSSLLRLRHPNPGLKGPLYPNPGQNLLL